MASRRSFQNKQKKTKKKKEKKKTDSRLSMFIHYPIIRTYKYQIIYLTNSLRELLDEVVIQHSITARQIERSRVRIPPRPDTPAREGAYWRYKC